jgi:hypothetical protein
MQCPTCKDLRRTCRACQERYNRLAKLRKCGVCNKRRILPSRWYRLWGKTRYICATDGRDAEIEQQPLRCGFVNVYASLANE